MSYTIGGYNSSWGSHIPVLIDVFANSSGPVLELGMGVFSTPLLHSLCVDSKRMLVSLENNPEFFDMHTTFVDEFHQIKLVDDWDKTEIENTHWGVAFVDQRPAEGRVASIKKLMNNTDYIVIHDSEPLQTGFYHYDLIYPLFKYRRDYILRSDYAHTTVLSNLKDLTILKQPHE